MSINKGTFLRPIAAVSICALTLTSVNIPVCAASKVSELQQQVNALQADLDTLNTDLSVLCDEIDDTIDKIDTVTEEVEKAKLDLTAAKLSEKNQYSSMKERIQFMYEGGSMSLVTILLESESMSDLINKVEYVNSIEQYDREQLEKLEEARATVEKKQAKLKKKKAGLKELQADLKEKQENLNSEIDSTSEKLSETESALQQAKKEAAARRAARIARKKAAAAKKKAEAAAKKAAEAAAAAQAAQEDQESQEDSSGNNSTDSSDTSTDTGSTDTGNTYSGSNDDLVLLAAILQAEAGATYDGMLAVATVIFNRVESSSYPNTISGVVYQSGQFAPTWDGALNRILSEGPSSNAYAAAKAAMAGSRYAAVANCYQFRAAYVGVSGTNVGGNVFF